MAVERAGPMDMTVLVSDHASVPMNMGALMVFEGPPVGPPDVAAVLRDRVARVPRLRQVLRPVPPGCGRPVWVDDSAFSVDRHLERVRRAGPVTDRALLEFAADLLCRPLDRRRPLWRAALLSAPERSALVMVVHHVLADGLAGLAVLSALADEGTDPAIDREFPSPPPAWRELAADANRSRITALRSSPGQLRHAAAGVRELGLRSGRPRRAEPISLVRPTSSRRVLATARVELASVVAAAHRHRGTVNDVVLAAVTGAMAEVLRARGERPQNLVVSVPVAGRSAADARTLGNNTGVRPIAVPVTADDRARLAAIVAVTSAARGSPARAASAVPLGVVFRALHRTGLFRFFIEHQRLVHTFETNLRGPSAAWHLAGRRIDALVPLVAAPGNVGVTFAALSYAGTLTVSVIADPEALTELDALTDALGRALTRLTTIGAGSRSFSS